MWLIADTHFNHENIIEYTGRPFDNVNQMNQTIIDNWNAVVAPGDTVLHLGDFAMGKDSVQGLVNSLNGNIHLIIGNHDRSGKQWFRDQGFAEVYSSLQVGNILFTHKPRIQLAEGLVNYHGHLHGKDTGLDKNKYRDFSCELTNYMPVWIKEEI